MGCVCGEHYITHHNDSNYITDLPLIHCAVFIIRIWIGLLLTLKTHQQKRSIITNLLPGCVGFILATKVQTNNYIHVFRINLGYMF